MTYFETMQLLSQFDLGAILISDDNYILEINDAADQLLHGEGKLRGQMLQSVVPNFTDFCNSKYEGRYFNIAFMEYLVQCPSPEGISLPEKTRMVCFRDATSEVFKLMLESIVNLIPEPMVLADEKSRIITINDATMRMEGLMQEDVKGLEINTAYGCQYGTVDGENVVELSVPVVLRTRRPTLGCRQKYTTIKGKQLDIVCDGFPIFHGGDILGVFCLTADSSRIDVLSKQILDLQDALLKTRSLPKAPRAMGEEPLSAQYHFSDIIHQSVKMKDIIAKCTMSAKSDSSVMLYGETGTGKELFAQSIHNASKRANRPFLAINCAAIPENLLESMLFGTEKGAYTGAERRAGLFEQADGGTLLLDEINSMSMALQAKLLRVLQDGVVRRVGGTEEKHVDVRVLSNTNVPPLQAVEEKKMRLDVYYRLGVINITIPPLRERKEDIPILVRTFFLRMNKKLSKSVSGIADDVMALFYAYDWPGNVRELQHTIEHAMNMLPADGIMIQREHLPEHILAKVGQAVPVAASKEEETGMLEQLLANVEQGVLVDTLVKNSGNISKTARELGISRQNLQHRLKRNNIDPEELFPKK